MVKRFVAVLFWGLWLAQPVVAVGDFNIDYHHSYTIDQSGATASQLDVSLTNNHADRFASEYKIVFASNRLQNIIAQSPQGRRLPSQINRQDAHTSVDLTFDQPVVGLGKTQRFSLSYTDPDISQFSGNVLEVTVPKIEQSSLIDTYRVDLYIPKEFGEPVLISPNTFTLTTDPAFNKISFSDLAKFSGISALFGQHQTYEFTLNYQVKNSSMTPLETQIALPPDTAYQKIFLDQINPQPLSIEPDIDGNWIATLGLEPKEQLQVTVKGKVVVSAKPVNQIPIYQNNLSIYLEERKFWPISSAPIQELVKKTKTAEDIFKYTVDTLAYDHSRLETASTKRLGALDALQSPQSSLCSEYADVFITLARAAGIPARLLTGYAFTQNEVIRPVGLIKDILHAWPEYYDLQEKRWIPVDPTWTDTTGGIDYFHHLDFSHIVFAIQGQYSDKPFSAGYYKDGSDQQDIIVTQSTVIPTQAISLNAALRQPVLSALGFQNNLNLVLQSQSNVALYNLPLHGNIIPQGEADYRLPYVLPYQTISRTLESVSLPDNLSTASLNLDTHAISINYDQTTQAQTTLKIVVFTAVLVAVIATLTLFIRRLLASRSK